MSVRLDNDIVRVTWHRNIPGQFQVIFRDGQLDRIRGSCDEARAFAEKLGFVLGSPPEADDLAEWIPQATVAADE